MSSSIINNKEEINATKTDIIGIQRDIDNLRTGVAVQDENFRITNKIKYTGHTDWRIRLEIYSNIPDTNSFLNSNLLFNNDYNLEYVDYVHLLGPELINSNILEFNTYSNCNVFDGDYLRTYQDETYRHYIYDNFNNRLLIRFTLNMLLKQSIDYIDINTFNNLPDYTYFINQQFSGSNINPQYSNLNKGWNTIDWYFIHDKDDNKPFVLGFNPLLHNSVKNKVELITGFLENRNNVITSDYSSFQYNINYVNELDSQYIIKQQSTINHNFTFSETFNYKISGITSNTKDFQINFGSYNFDETLEDKITFKLIEITNNNDELLKLTNLKLSYSNLKYNNTLSNNNYYEIGFDKKYIFTQSHFVNSNKDDYIITDNNTITQFNLSFNSALDTFNFDINIEYYFETRENDINKILTIQHKDISEKSLDNKVIVMKDGSVGIGTDNTHEYSLYVNNINFSKKGIYCADDITILSDAQFKTNIKTIENPIEKLMALRGVSYNRIDRDINETRYGFIAQEVLDILPEACDGQNGIKNTDILALLVEAVKEIYKNDNNKK